MGVRPSGPLGRGPQGEGERKPLGGPRVVVVVVVGGDRSRNLCWLVSLSGPSRSPPRYLSLDISGPLSMPPSRPLFVFLYESLSSSLRKVSLGVPIQVVRGLSLSLSRERERHIIYLGVCLGLAPYRPRSRPLSRCVHI